MNSIAKIKITGTGSYAPERVVTNDEIASMVDTSDEWIYSKLGIKSRHVSAENERTSDLAAKAGISAIKQAGLDKEDIDLIIVATATPDRTAPSTACLVKNKMGILNHCPALDIAAVCSGFVYAMTIAASMIGSGTHQRALVIGADTFSKITDWSRRDSPFFGDGAGAVVVESTDLEDAFYYAKLYSETTNTDHFTVFPEDQFFTMNANAVYETGSQVLPTAIRTVLADTGYTISDVTSIIPHQPSITLLRAAAEELGVPFSVFKTNMETYANTSSATVPLLLDETVRAGGVTSGDLVVLAAVGSGWTWAAGVMRWL